MRLERGDDARCDGLRRRRDAPSRLDSARRARFKPAYLIHGDDHGRIAERRARLRAMAEAESGVGGVEVFEGDACTPEAIAGALSAMTFALGRRFVIADGVERWKDADVEPVAAAMAGLDGRRRPSRSSRARRAGCKAPAEAARGGQGRRRPGRRRGRRQAARAAALAAERAAELGIELDSRPPARWSPRSATASSGSLRELEKLAIEHGEGARIGVEEVEESCASSAERKAVDAGRRARGRRRAAATRALLELRQQGERLPGAAVRDGAPAARRAGDRRGAGRRPAARRRSRRALRMPSFAADRLIADVAQARRRGLPAGAGADGRPRAREPRRRRRACSARRPPAVRGGDSRRRASARGPRPRGTAARGGRRGTSCGRRCCGAARRA